MTKRKYLPLHASYALERAEAELAALFRVVDKRLAAQLQIVDEAAYCKIRSHAARIEAALAEVEREGVNGHGLDVGSGADVQPGTPAARAVGGR
jgi:hypothetical protein